MSDCDDAGAEAPWTACFRAPDGGAPVLLLEQRTPTQFALCSTIEFVGPTDVAGPRSAGPSDLSCTDLASVPPALQWFVNTYGPHTPAALVHDRLVGAEAPAGYDRIDADHLWFDMLRSLGLPPLRRWMMWAAVAAGTQWSLGGRLKLRMLVWALASLAGMVALVYGVVGLRPWIVAGALVAPLPFAALWGRQWKAGLLAAATAAWVLPPTVFGLVGHGVYWCLEWVVLRFAGADEPADRPIGIAEY